MIGFTISRRQFMKVSIGTVAMGWGIVLIRSGLLQEGRAWNPR